MVGVRVVSSVDGHGAAVHFAQAMQLRQVTIRQRARRLYTMDQVRAPEGSAHVGLVTPPDKDLPWNFST